MSPQRLWANPAQPFEIVRDADRIVITYEFMDAVRVVHLNRSAAPADAERTELGVSVGRFEGETLVIETSQFAPGVVTQYAPTAPGQFAGILHSDQYRTTERISINAATGELDVAFTHEDPLYLISPQTAPPLNFGRRPDLRVAPYNCVPDPL